MNRKSISSAFRWVAGFLIKSSYMHVPNRRVSICGSLVPDDLEYEHIIYHFEARDLEIPNI